jgi:hypothetical protein
MVITACEKDKIEKSIEEIQENINTPQIEYISYEKVPKIVDAITNHTGKSSLKSYSKSKIIEFEKAFIDLNSILRVKDVEGFTNYSFMLYVDDAPPTEFYNLIVSESPIGEMKTPYILKYVIDEDALDTFVANKMNFRFFKGVQYRMSFYNFFNDSVHKTSSDCEEEIPVNNPGGGSNGNFYAIPSNNSLQTDPYGYDYSSTVIPGDSYELFLNSYDEGTGASSSYSAIVRDPLVPISITSQPVVSYTLLAPTGGSMPIVMTGYSITVTTGSSGCFMTKIKYYNDGTSSMTGSIVSCPTLLNPQQLSPENTTKSGDCDDGGGEIGVITSQAISYIEDCLYPTVLTSDQLNYLQYGGGKAPKLRMYLQEQACTQESKDLTMEIIQAGADGTLVSLLPFFQYPPGSSYSSDYPKLTEYLQNKMPMVKDISVITNAIQDITNLTLSQIQKDLQWGKGPIIKIIQLDNYTSDTGPDTVGLFDGAENSEVIFLDIDWVNNLENDNFDENLVDYFGLESNREAFLFFLGVTVLHEYVHYGDYLNGNNYKYPEEEGDLFETRVYGEDVDSGTLLFKKN